MREEILNQLNQLIGKPLRDIGRAGGLVWLSIGDRLTIEGIKGKREVGTYNIHLQCGWKILCASYIWTDNNDLIENQHKETKFDYLKMAIPVPLKICLVEVDGDGSFKLTFENDWSVSVTTDVGLPNDEMWRLIKYGQGSSHFVVLGSRIDIDG